MSLRNKADQLERLISQRVKEKPETDWPAIYKDWTKEELWEVAHWPKGKPYSESIIQHLKESGYHGPF